MAKKQTYSGKVKLREKKLSNGDRSLYLDIYHHGKRTYDYLKLYLTGDRQQDTETRRIAETIRSKREIELQASEHGIMPAHVRQANFVEYFKALKEEKNHSSWNATYLQLKEYTGGHLAFGALTPEKVEGFRNYLLGKVGANTAHLYFSKFKAALSRAVREGKLVKSPAANVQGIKQEDSERVFLTLDDLRKLEKAACPNSETKRAFLFACYTGLRISDVRALRWGMIHNNQIEYRQKKTSRVEYLPLSTAAQKYLGEPGEPDTPVFNLPTHAPIYHALTKWAQKAGVTKSISFHVSRHTFATLVLTHGGDLYTVSKLLGHASVRTTEVYGKIVDEKKRAAVELIPEL